MTCFTAPGESMTRQEQQFILLRPLISLDEPKKVRGGPFVEAARSR